MRICCPERALASDPAGNALVNKRNDAQQVALTIRKSNIKRRV